MVWQLDLQVKNSCIPIFTIKNKTKTKTKQNKTKQKQTNSQTNKTSSLDGMGHSNCAMYAHFFN